jgi:hypothetical protein
MQIQPQLQMKRPRWLIEGLPRSNKFRLLLLMPLLLGLGSEAPAQGLTSPLGTGSAPIPGAVGMRPPIVSGTQNPGAKMHFGPTGTQGGSPWNHAINESVSVRISRTIQLGHGRPGGQLKSASASGSLLAAAAMMRELPLSRIFFLSRCRISCCER